MNGIWAVITGINCTIYLEKTISFHTHTIEKWVVRDLAKGRSDPFQSTENLILTTELRAYLDIVKVSWGCSATTHVAERDKSSAENVPCYEH